MLTLGTVAVASPANAATGDCNTTINIKPRAAYSYFMVVPKEVGGSTNCYMRDGFTGPEVRALQTTLVYCYSGAESWGGPEFGLNDIDGVYGAKTAYALKDAQRIALIDDDGIYGPDTAGRIEFPWHNPNNDSITSTCTRRDGSDA
ncbi:peptidoglycan-binding domain-containing protein [Promicromonospora soli]